VVLASLLSRSEVDYLGTR
jgi:hypothetical protein